MSSTQKVMGRVEFQRAINAALELKGYEGHIPKVRCGRRLFWSRGNPV